MADNPANTHTDIRNGLKLSSASLEYIRKGRELLQDSSSIRSGANIFPSIFFHSLIESGESTRRKYRDIRTSSEAELLVHTAFSTLLKQQEYDGSILMHSFKCDRAILDNIGIQGILHEKGTKGNQCEHDFIIILKSKIFVLLEVKTNKGCASQQLRNSERLIKSICTAHDVHNPTIVKVKASPFISREVTIDNHVHKLYKDTITKQCNLSKWWNETLANQKGDSEFNINSKEAKFKDMCALFVGIWASKNSNRIQIAQVVDEIDKRLKEADLSQGKNHRAMTNNIAPLMDIAIGGRTIPENVIPSHVQHLIASSPSNPFKYLTAEQLEVLSDQRYKQCVIRGPGGSGKTVAMLINVIRLSYRTGDMKLPIVIIAYNKACAEILKLAFTDCQLSVKLLCLQESLDSSKELVDVIIIYSNFVIDTGHEQVLRKFLIEKGRFHLFIENLQQFMIVATNFIKIIESFQNTDQYLWILVDDMQNPIVSNEENLHDDPTQFFISMYKTIIAEKTFSAVVRSTKEITEGSIAIRNVIFEYDTGNERGSFLIGSCKPFHLIHGPKPFLHILKCEKTRAESINKVEQTVKAYIKIYKKKYQQFGERSGILYNFMPGSRLRKWDFLEQTHPKCPEVSPNLYPIDIETREQSAGDSSDACSIDIKIHEEVIAEAPSDGCLIDIKLNEINQGSQELRLIERRRNFQYVDTLYSMAHEFTTVLGILYIVRDTNSKVNDWLYRSMYLVLTRARVVADIILICEDFELSTEQFEEKFDIERGLCIVEDEN